MDNQTINTIIITILGSSAMFGFLQFIVNKYFTRNQDKANYSADLLKLANDATDALQKTRAELLATEEDHEATLKAIHSANDETIKSIRTEYDAKLKRLKSRVLDLENVQKVYKITFDLLTHPHVEIKNLDATTLPLEPYEVPPQNPQDEY